MKLAVSVTRMKRVAEWIQPIVVESPLGISHLAFLIPRRVSPSRYPNKLKQKSASLNISAIQMIVVVGPLRPQKSAEKCIEIT